MCQNYYYSIGITIKENKNNYCNKLKTKQQSKT